MRYNHKDLTLLGVPLQIALDRIHSAFHVYKAWCQLWRFSELWVPEEWWGLHVLHSSCCLQRWVIAECDQVAPGNKNNFQLCPYYRRALLLQNLFRLEERLTPFSYVPDQSTLWYSFKFFVPNVMPIFRRRGPPNWGKNRDVQPKSAFGINDRQFRPWSKVTSPSIGLRLSR